MALAPTAGVFELEVRIAIALSTQRPLVRLAQCLLASAARYLGLRSLADAQTSGRSQRAHFNELLSLCGTDTRRSFVGRLGLSASEIGRVFAGLGDIRESMCHFYKFINEVLARDACGPRRRDDFTALASQSGWDTDMLAAMLLAAEQCAGKAAHALEPVVEFAKIPWSPVRQWQHAMRDMLPHERDGWSLMTREHYVALGGVLSAAELALPPNPLGAELVPWQDAGRMFRLRESAAFEAATASGAPLVSGISGVTLQSFVFGRVMLGALNFDARAMRDVCLHFLVATQCHSFAEVCAAAVLATDELPRAMPTYRELVEQQDAADEDERLRACLAHEHIDRRVFDLAAWAPAADATWHDR